MYELNLDPRLHTDSSSTYLNSTADLHMPEKSSHPFQCLINHAFGGRNHQESDNEQLHTVVWHLCCYCNS